ncbi:putative membrane protein [Pseudomonas sp. 37 R 15]|uniref:trimeric intracellular cation channel family protein n=1 Tax=Pseudomonas sp. 37 R 15 TaxID=1844104 RepID=UPI000811E52B|nr:trimeric intracellular cation channel family protein [Pseudomonas sp. 37 R 15]CRM79885.1 putative membrane protein [Pseudomonas sp. 37 R 15]
MDTHLIYTVIDLLGTFAFGVSGAIAARQQRLDLFGIATITFIVACGGGILRDLCLGTLPPAGLSSWRYLIVSLIASAWVVCAYPMVCRMKSPVQLFDSIGLGLFAVAGAKKALAVHAGAEVAILLGMVSAVGGGVLRDILLSRVPSILQREIYASAALAGAGVEVLLSYNGADSVMASWLTAAGCTLLRLASLHYRWRLPSTDDEAGNHPDSAH